MTERAGFEIVLLTPPGRGAVATVLVSGPQGVASVEQLFTPAAGVRLSQARTDRPLFGRWRNAAHAADGEEVVVRRISPAAVEIHCHGGVAAWRAIADSLLALGGTETDWQDYQRAHAANRIAAEATIALAAARTQRTAALLLDQLQGALQRELIQIIATLRAKELAPAGEQLELLNARARVGMHLTHPWRVVLAGRPNVGKSSLINALLGYERVIVFDQPGTTRDVVTASAAFEGWPVELADTAGLRLAMDEIEQAGITKAKSTAAAADLVVLVFDASAPWSDEDAALLAAQPTAIVVHNKIDRLVSVMLDDRPAGIAISALKKQNVERLLAEIVRRLIGEISLPRGAAIPFTHEQAEAISQAHGMLALGKPLEAALMLQQLLS